MNKRAARTRQLRFSWLDFKVGLRMLARFPVLTTVGTVAIAVAIALGSLYFEAVNKWQHPKLPIRDANRVISIRNWDAERVDVDARALNDFATWRGQAKTIEHMGAAVLFTRNVQTEDQRVEPVSGAEISASAFAIMGTPPLLGRTLTAQDERPSAEPVVVIGHSLWSTRFARVAAVLG